MSDGGDSEFRISWKSVGGISLVANAGLIAGVIALAARRDADALSVVALTLAVVAFIAQIVIFAVQTTHAGQQLRRAEDLNNDTGTLVGGLQAKIETMYHLVSEHNDYLMRITQASSNVNRAKEEEIGESESENRPSEPARQAGEEAGDSGVTVGVDAASSDSDVLLANVPSPSFTSASDEIVWPTAASKAAAGALDPGWPDDEDEARNDLAELEKFDTHALSQWTFEIAWEAQLINEGRASMVEVVAIAMSPSELPLLKAGLLREGPPREIKGEKPRRTVRVSKRGWKVARLLYSPWPPPYEDADLVERLWDLRESLPVEARRRLAQTAEWLDLK
jgi:hypothetical protein